MKSHILNFSFIVLLVIISCKGSNESKEGKIVTKTDSLVTKKLTYMDKVKWQDFIGKSVNELLQEIKTPYSKYVYFTEPPGYLAGASFLYSDTLTVRAYIEDAKYLKAFNTNLDWDIELFKKEKIWMIKVYKNENDSIYVFKK